MSASVRYCGREFPASLALLPATLAEARPLRLVPLRPMA